MNPKYTFELSGQNNCHGRNKNPMVRENNHNYDMIYNDKEFSINFSLEVTIVNIQVTIFLCLKMCVF